METIYIILISIGTISVITISCYLYKTYQKKDENIYKESLINYGDIYPMNKIELYL